MSSHARMYFTLAVSLLFISIYIAVCFIHSNSFIFMSDTLQYQQRYDEINNILLPYGIEFVVPIIMYTVRFLGGDFRDFIFFSLMLWLPILFYGWRYIGLLFIIISVFFLSRFFVDNSTLLIRQYYAALFYIMWVFIDKKKSFLRNIMALLAVTSHLSAIFWIFLSLEWVRKKLSSIYFIIPIFVFVVIVFFIKVDFISPFINFILGISDSINISELTRKVSFYSSEELEDILPVKPTLLYLSLFIFIVACVFNILKIENGAILPRCELLLIMQSALIIIFKDNVVLANRIGFFPYFFSIPILVFYFSMFMRVKR